MGSAIAVLAITGLHSTSAMAMGAGPSIAAAPAETQGVAKHKYQAGAGAYAAGRYKDAIDLFLEANRLAPSAALSFDVARAYEKLGDKSRALEWYRDYLRRSPSAADAGQVRLTIESLDRELVKKGDQQVTILSQPSGATVVIDGQPVGITPGTFDLKLGVHHARLSQKGFVAADRDFVLTIDAARDVVVSLTAEPPPRREQARTSPPATTKPSPGPAPVPPTPALRSLPVSTSATMPMPEQDVQGPTTSPLVTWGWVTLGAGGAAFGGAIVFEALRSSAENAAKHESTQIGYSEELDKAKSRQTVARVLAGVGGALTITGGALLIVGFGKSKKDSSVSVAVTGSPQGGSVWLGGKF